MTNPRWPGTVHEQISAAVRRSHPDHEPSDPPPPPHIRPPRQKRTFREWLEDTKLTLASMASVAALLGGWFTTIQDRAEKAYKAALHSEFVELMKRRDLDGDGHEIPGTSLSEQLAEVRKCKQALAEADARGAKLEHDLKIIVTGIRGANAAAAQRHQPAPFPLPREYQIEQAESPTPTAGH
jgi:hypothetical protein